MRHPPIRVLLLDPSAPRRHRLQQLLASDPSLHVIASAADADGAVEMAARKQAEVIVFGQSGSHQEAIAWTRTIMQARATPIVVVCAETAARDEKEAFALMEAGALAVLHDPGPSTAAQHRETLGKLLESVRLMAEVKVVRRWASTAGTVRPAAERPARAPGLPHRAPAAPRQARVELVAIGASTGGPVALQQLLCALPAAFPVPIVIVQHMADGFLHGLAEWLSSSCAIPVEVAGPATELRPGRAYLAPDGIHMRVAPNARLAFDAAPKVNGHRPAVACLLASVAAHYGGNAIAILLTGMGKDGAAELKQLHDAGAVTIAQDEASSVVHGMPGEAIRCGGATYVMSPEEIGAALPALVQR